MNSLSWFIYIAQAIPGLAVVLNLVASAVLTVYAVKVIAVFAHNDSYSVIKKKPYPGMKLPTLAALLFTVAVFIPSKTTLYSILAVELGEEVVTSEVGKELLTDVREVIQFQLEELKGKKE